MEGQFDSMSTQMAIRANPYSGITRGGRTRNSKQAAESNVTASPQNTTRPPFGDAPNQNSCSSLWGSSERRFAPTSRRDAAAGMEP